MSRESVEVVRRMLQAFADGGLDAMAEFLDPDIDWRAAEGAIDDVGEMHGRVAVRGYIQDWIDTFDDFSVVVEELRDVGDGGVLAIQAAREDAGARLVMSRVTVWATIGPGAPRAECPRARTALCRETV